MAHQADGDGGLQPRPALTFTLLFNLGAILGAVFGAWLGEYNIKYVLAAFYALVRPR